MTITNAQEVIWKITGTGSWTVMDTGAPAYEEVLRMLFRSIFDVLQTEPANEKFRIEYFYHVKALLWNQASTLFEFQRIVRNIWDVTKVRTKPLDVSKINAEHYNGISELWTNKVSQSFHAFISMESFSLGYLLIVQYFPVTLADRILSNFSPALRKLYSKPVS